ncbi:acetone carboxylase subunit gamma [Helicobacter pylori]|nr:acetone carboxylase subunit gamma [Helicobacter pylori]
MVMSKYTQEQIKNLVEGNLDWNTVLKMLSMPKDHERFQMYLKVLQDKVDFDDKIVLPLGPHLFVVQDAQKKWVIKCSCGHAFCAPEENWKLHANIYVRDTAEKMEEVYPKLLASDTNWQVYREYICPDCGILLDVEAPTPWYPVIHDFEPDIETFYKDWLGIQPPERH